MKKLIIIEAEAKKDLLGKNIVPMTEKNMMEQILRDETIINNGVIRYHIETILNLDEPKGFMTNKEIMNKLRELAPDLKDPKLTNPFIYTQIIDWFNELENQEVTELAKYERANDDGPIHTNQFEQNNDM